MNLNQNQNKPHAYSLLAPGPVNLHPEVLKILALPMIHHRTPEFDQILRRCLGNLKKIFQTEQSVFTLSSTGSGGMECLLVNTLQQGDKVLALVSGKFGERWADMAEVFGAEVDRMNIPWGEAVDLSLLETQLRTKKYDAVLSQACETSTGVAHPIQKMSELIQKIGSHQTLFLVDAITALGAYSLPMDAWNIDGLVAGSQKAFMLPTGLSFVSFSEKAWKKIESNKTPRFYFDIRKEKQANERGETYFSSSVSHVRALDWVLSHILEQGLESLFETIRKRAEFARHFVQKLGLKIYSQTPSNSLTAILLPSEIDGQILRTQLEKEYQVTVMGGQDQLKGKILRIGHMGYILDEEMIRFFLSLQTLLHARGFQSPLLTKEEMLSWLKKQI